MAKAAKIEKNVECLFHGLNIIVRSELRSGEKMYFDLWKQLFAYGTIDIGHGQSMAIKSAKEERVNEDGNDMRFFSGEIVKFNNLDTSGWYDENEKVSKEYQVPDGLHPGLKIAEYIFIPQAHRFFFKLPTAITVQNLLTFLSDGLNFVKETDETSKVNVLSESETIKSILNSKYIKRLKINVTYSNDDLNENAKKLMDDLLRGSDIGDGDFELKRQKEKPLNTEGDFITGLVELAQDNGSVEATIKEARKKSYKIRTIDHPENYKIVIKKSDSWVNKLFKSIIDKLRNETGDTTENSTAS